jgi:hypothetical protein
MRRVFGEKGQKTLAKMWPVLQTNLRRLLGFSPHRLFIRLRVLFLQVCELTQSKYGVDCKRE